MSCSWSSLGSLPFWAASISPRSSRSSGSMKGKPIFAYISSSLRPATRFSPRNAPYSLIFSFCAKPILRRAMLCSLEPVKYIRAAP